jgi:hypothetical protein
MNISISSGNPATSMSRFRSAFPDVRVWKFADMRNCPRRDYSVVILFSIPKIDARRIGANRD